MYAGPLAQAFEASRLRACATEMHLTGAQSSYEQNEDSIAISSCSSEGKSKKEPTSKVEFERMQN